MKQQRKKTLLLPLDAIDLEKYIPAGQSEFTTALQAAHAVLADPASQDAVNQAASALNTALMNLRLKADESLIASLKSFVRTVSLMNLEQYSEPVRMMAKAQIQKVQKVLEDHKSGANVLSMDDARALEAENNKVMQALRPYTTKPEEPTVKPDDSTKPEEVKKPEETKPAENKPAAEKTEKETRPAASSVKPAKSVKTSVGGFGLWMTGAVTALGALLAGKKRK